MIKAEAAPQGVRGLRSGFCRFSVPGMLELEEREGGTLHPRGPEVGRVSISHDHQPHLALLTSLQCTWMVYKRTVCVPRETGTCRGHTSGQWFGWAGARTPDS